MLYRWTDFEIISQECSLGDCLQNCSNRSAPLNKMAARAKNRKTFKRLLLLNECNDFEMILPEGSSGRVAQSVGHLTRKSGVLGSIPGLATYFRFSFRFFKKGSCQLLAKVCARSTG